MADPRFTLPKDATSPLYRVAISRPHIGLRAEPKPSASLQTELIYGQEFDVHAEFGTALLGRVRSLVRGSRRRGYVGYLPKSATAQDFAKPTHIVTAISGPIFRKANIKSPVKIALPMNALINAAPSENQLMKVSSLGYVHSAHVRSLKSKPPTDFVAVAETFIARPYIWGGTGGVGVDCSGLVQMALAACGVDAPRDADQQEKHLGQLVTDGSLQRGDLIFWPGHVGIMESASRFLHANAFHMKTAREPYKKAVQRIGPPRMIKRL